MHAIMIDFMILGTFDEAPGTVQSPGVIRDLQHCASVSGDGGIKFSLEVQTTLDFVNSIDMY